MEKQSLKKAVLGAVHTEQVFGVKMRDAGQWNKKVHLTVAFFRTLCHARNAAKDAMVKHICLAHAVYIENKGKAMESKNLFCERPLILHGVGRRLKDAIFTSHDWVCDAANKVSFILQFQALYRTCVRLVQCSSQNRPIKQRKSVRLNPQMHEKEQNKRYTAKFHDNASMPMEYKNPLRYWDE